MEDNPRSLRVERMDLVNPRLHDDGDGPAVRLEEQLGALEDMCREGLLTLVGISNATRQQAETPLDLVDPGQVQNSFSIVDREDEDVLDLCRERAVALVPFFPLGSAFAGGPARLARDPGVAAVAAKHGATPSQIALARAHLEENVAAGDVALDDEDLATLGAVEQAGHPMP